RAAGAFPGFTGSRRLLARALGLALGFLQAFACALQFVLGDAHSLLRHFGLQSGSLEGLCGKGCRFAAALLHLAACEAKRRPVSHNRRSVSTIRSYPQNLCITMCTEHARQEKERAPAKACITLREISPALRCPARCSAWR